MRHSKFSCGFCYRHLNLDFKYGCILGSLVKAILYWTARKLSIFKYNNMPDSGHAQQRHGWLEQRRSLGLQALQTLHGCVDGCRWPHAARGLRASFTGSPSDSSLRSCAVSHCHCWYGRTQLGVKVETKQGNPDDVMTNIEC